LITALPASAASEDLAPLLARVLEHHHVPAMAAAVISESTITARGAVGVRRAGSPEKVTIEDKWHIGSCTKSMTATLAAMLVEEKKLRWDSTVAEVLVDLHDTMDPAWQPVTLEQLLAHRGGAPATPPANLWKNASAEVGSAVQQRLEFVRGLLLRPPEADPGTKFIYSNQGYAIAGVMLERVAKMPWEELVRERLFKPLLMSSAGFGAPAAAGRVDQPWGHVLEDEKPKPIAPGKGADNPPAISPAGRVHASLADLVRYAGWHARGETAGSTLLSRQSFTKLHTPPRGQDYALGWARQEQPGLGRVLVHAGSNTMFFMIIVVAPEKRAAFVVATNCGGSDAEAACGEALKAVIGRFQAADTRELR
jgi:CubicO group peptidase (beta-lactamase class C family)